MEISKVERKILAQQFKILALLEPSERGAYENRQEILESGYELHYSTLFQDIYDPFPESETVFVHDVLSMYSSFKDSIEKHKIQDEKLLQQLRFTGFDGNNETAHVGYLQFFIGKMDRFNELKTDGPRRDDFNSHMQMRPIYARQLKKYNELKQQQGRVLPEDSLRKVVAYPDRQ